MDTLKETVKRLSETGDRLLVCGVPEGFDALLLVTLATEGGDVLMVSMRRLTSSGLGDTRS